MKNNCEIGIPCYDDINFFVPFDFEKAKSDDPKKKYDSMFIYGEASDSSVDSEGETMEPNGFEIERFLVAGKINLEHYTVRKGSPKYWIGEPVEAKIENNKFYVKAKLWKAHPLAREFWDMLHIMKESGSTRKPGFSIEGTAILRDPHNPKRVLKARINNCAVTMSPINANSWLDIVKGEQTVDFVKYEYDESANGGQEYLLDMTMPNGTRITIDKSMKIKIYKAMSAGHQSGTELTGKITTGASLKKESVDKKITDLKKAIEIVSDYQNKVGFDKKSVKIIKKSILTFVK